METYKEPKLLPKSYLKSDEEIYLELRPAVSNFFAMPILLVIITFAFPVIIPFTISSFIIGYFLYTKKIYALTNKRVIVLKGFFNKYHSEAPLDKIQNIDLKIPFFAGNVGIISFDTAGTFRKLSWDFISHPREIYNKVTSIINK